MNYFTNRPEPKYASNFCVMTSGSCVDNDCTKKQKITLKAITEAVFALGPLCAFIFLSTIVSNLLEVFRLHMHLVVYAYSLSASNANLSV